ncbi:hypothetical protein D3C80_1903460 [compost metagenome]
MSVADPQLHLRAGNILFPGLGDIFIDPFLGIFCNNRPFGDVLIFFGGGPSRHLFDVLIQIIHSLL